MRSSAISLPRWGASANDSNNQSLRRRISIRFNNNYGSPRSPSPSFIPLTVFRGLAGLGFILFGEFFWMHLHRISLPWEGKVLGGMALVLGCSMAAGAILGAAAISFSQDDGCRIPLLVAVYLSAPLSLADFVAALTFFVNRSQIIRLDREHTEEHQRPSPPDAPEDPEMSEHDTFRRMYDLVIFLALALSVLEMLAFRLGMRRLAASAEGGGSRPRVAGWGLETGPLQSLLDEEDVREAALEERVTRHESVQQTLFRQQRFEQLRRAQLEKNEDLLEQHLRGGNRNTAL